MKTFFVDANYILRYVLNDIKSQADIAERLFRKAQRKELNIVLLPEILFEVEYVLRKVKKSTRGEISQYLNSILSSYYFDIRNRTILQKAVNKYETIAVDLVDLFLFFTAQNENAEVLTFDEDFKKLK